MKVEIVTPDATLYSNEAVKSVTLPGIDGSFQLLENHAAIVSALAEGEIVVKDLSNNEENISIKSGLLECLKNNVSILVERA